MTKVRDVKAWLLPLVAAVALIAAPVAGAAPGVSPNGMRGLGGATEVIERLRPTRQRTPMTTRTATIEKPINRLRTSSGPSRLKMVR